MYSFNAVASVILLCSAGAAVLAANFPPLNSFINYGKTRKRSLTASRSLVQILADVTVPKSWFYHFYILLVSLLVSRCYKKQSMNAREVFLLCQGLRRLLEQFYTFHASANSKMHLSHYIVGILFYTTQALCQVRIRANLTPTWWVAFFCVSIYQHLCHSTLGATPKYQFPAFPLIGKSDMLSTACPHYGAEIILYAIVFALADLDDADGGFYFSLSSLIWVTVSLAISGETSRRYYSDPKVSKNHQRHIRWAVIPLIY